MKQNKILIALSLILLASPAYAYLDPGTGSIILQSILAIVAGALAFTRIYWHKLKSFFCKKDDKNEKQKPAEKKS